ncbi:MAG: hypothetical protein PVH87_02235 [Desulfobacteraceae bacterium]
MDPQKCMIAIMADIICSSNDYDDDRLNEKPVWEQFMREVLEHMELCPDEEMRKTLDGIDREQFQQWIDEPLFWEELNQELERRAQVLMTLLPSEHQGNC